MQSRPTFEQVRDAAMAHVRARGWDEENTGRGLAISISLEASELLEYFQWQEENVGDTEDLASELADIIIYTVQFADKYGIDILPEVLKKLEKQPRNIQWRYLRSRIKKSVIACGARRSCHMRRIRRCEQAQTPRAHPHW